MEHLDYDVKMREKLDKKLQFLLQLDKLDLLISEAIKSLSYDPDNVDTYFSLAQAYYLSGNYLEAEKAILQVLKLEPNDAVNPLIVWGYFIYK